MTEFASPRIVDFRIRAPADLRPQLDLPASLADRYAQVLALDARAARTSAELLDELAAAGVDHGVVHAEYEYGDIADHLNEAVAAFVGGHAQLSGFGAVSLDSSSMTRTVAQVRRVASLGLLGLNLQPAFFGRAIDDRELYPVYAAAQEAGLVVAVHTGIGYDLAKPLDGEQPLRLDRVACAFPGLRLVACHAGWPWATELAAVARKHPTVYFDFGGLAPRYLAEPGTGWEVLFRYLNSLLAGQALFATDWPAFEHAPALAQWSALPLKDETRARLLAGNCLDLLGLSPEPG
ncbi:MAG: amidohydrolase family protein [Mycobacteriales bacterium]